MNPRNLVRLVIVLSLLIGYLIVMPASRAQQDRSSASFEKTVQPFLSENCYVCHNAGLKSGNLNLESYKTEASVLKDAQRWEKVLRKLRAGEMPPAGMPRPDRGQAQAVTNWIETALNASRGGAQPNPGHVTARRLNRTEYNNTVRDLLAVDLHCADDFPQDDSGYGFDNIGDVLSVSPVLMEDYFSAAEKIARAAIFGPESMKPSLVRLPAGGRRIVTTLTPPADYDTTGLSLPNSLHLTYRFPVEGQYIFRLILGGERPGGSEPMQLALWVDGKQVETGEIDPAREASFSQDKQELSGNTRAFRVRIAAGDHWVAASIMNLFEGLPASYNGPNPSKRPAPVIEFKPPPGLPPERIAEIRKRFEARKTEKVPANDARINALEIGGPYSAATGPSSETLKKIYVCGHLNGHHQPDCARRIVASLARRAFRRPVTLQEVSRLAALVSGATKAGDSFEEGLCVAIQGMLVSPHFLFRIEKDPVSGGESAHQISQHELASRLSYFLWSSMPDDELLACAARGTLRQPAVLAAQVRRMLNDPKSKALVENFGGQWLELRKLESAKPDRQRFPEFEDYLRMSMRRETELFFENIVHEDRSILDFIDGDYTFLNERLAKFYQIPGVKGPEFRKVSLTDRPERGGIVTHASVLTISSYATRTSPVLRGRWILENILNSPPPPPPPDVPNLDEAKVASAASLRQQLEEHRKNTTCAACHVRMDPLGFGLENYDAVGGWRTREGNSVIDSSGVLPDGRSFRGPAELKSILKSDREAFAECLTEKLSIYALGRGLESYDKPTVKKISQAVAASDYRFSSLVLEIVKSAPFQMRVGG
ncbi:MAG TPA: DUF1592 domain-containing protein [Blastocatellia bacterium]|nr:DUF1592 domain-containing protein [Blastocatellia bacterium]